MEKLTVACYIWQNVRERGLKAFEKRIKDELQKHYIKCDFIAENAHMERASGYGSYYKTIRFLINNHPREVKEFTHDSELWDNWNEPTPKEKRQLFEAVFFGNIEKVLEEINEHFEE